MSSSSQGNSSNLKNYQHVFVIMMENTGYASLIGNPNVSRVNSAVATYGVATNYYGVSHSSQPNYIAATSGSTDGVSNDNDTTFPPEILAATIVEDLQTTLEQFTAIAEDIGTPLPS